jgi:DNA-binding transcriptional ArsR family regulator
MRKQGGRVGVTVKLRQELEELTASVCKALNDPKRLAILYALSEASHSVTDLCELLEVSQSNISQHLTMLRDRGLVDTQRDGNRVIYALRDRRVVDAIDLLRSVMNDEVARRHALRQAR